MKFQSGRQGWEAPRLSGLRHDHVGHEEVRRHPGARACHFCDPSRSRKWVDSSTDPKVCEAAKAYSAALTPLTESQEKALEDGVPTARVVRLPGAHHFVYLSNEADVLREMPAFLAGLH
jgi:hypothetical protein